MKKIVRPIIKSVVLVEKAVSTIGNNLDKFVARWYRLVALFAWVAAILIFYWIEIDHNFPVYKYQVESYSITPSSFYDDSSQQIVLKEKVCSKRAENIRASYQFVDHIIYNLPSSMLNIQKGCHIFYINFGIPSGVYPDIYSLNATLTASINPLKSMNKTFTLLLIKISDTKPKYQILVPDYNKRKNVVLAPTKDLFRNMYDKQLRKNTTEKTSVFPKKPESK